MRAKSLQGIQLTINEINSNGSMSLAQLQANGKSLFDSLLAFENYPSQGNDNPLNISFRQSIEELDYPLGITAYELNQELIINFKFAGELFDNSIIKTLINTALCLFNDLIIHPDLEHRNAKTHNYLNTIDYKQIVYVWNETSARYPSGKTICQLFEEQVLKTPDKVALVYEGVELSYTKLNSQANQLAHYLLKNFNIQGDDLIILCQERSEQLLAVILGVLKSGAAYVPVDPSYPFDRIEYILSDTKSKLVLSTLKNESKWQKQNSVENEYEVLYIDNHDFLNDLSVYSVENPVININSRNLAYVIYTSGTTGKPKGVMIEHEGVNNLITSTIIHRQLTVNSKIAQTAPYIFDSSVIEIFPTICIGAELHILSEEKRKDLGEIHKYVNKNKVTHLFLTSKLAELFFSLYEKFDFKFALIVAGEKFGYNNIKPENVVLINEYGPTEATVCSTFNTYEYFVDGNNIGKPIINTKAYILNSDLRPLPVGACGELYIGGIGLARGYLNRPELTAGKFIANPFQSEEERELCKNSRLYKTGDLARYLPDGNIEYLGRNDFQVKIRGFRIELGEIEQALSQYPLIKQNVVLALDYKDSLGNASGNKYLAGYYVSEERLDEDKVLSGLGRQLPDYMVPSVLVWLKSLPLTINGKLDRRALPEPEFSVSNKYVAPRTELEISICKIYAEILGITYEKVGIEDDFFKLGGNSILAIKLSGQINRRLKTNISLSDLFKARTVANLGELINGSELVKEVVIPSLPDSQDDRLESMLSFAQERLWFIEQYENGSNAYNIPLINKIIGEVDHGILEDSLIATVNRHQVLHSLIKMNEDGGGYQLVLKLDEVPLKIGHIVVKSEDELKEYFEKESRYIFKLDREYPIRISLVRLNEVSYLCVVVHHIAFDGWSSEVFLRDIIGHYNYYKAKAKGESKQELELPKLSIGYRDFALWQREYLSGSRLEAQLLFWRNSLSGYETLNLPLDYVRPLRQNYAGSNKYFSLDIATSDKLRNLARELEVSLYSLLLSGFYILLRGYSNQDDIVIGSPIANRHYEQLVDMVGFFVNSLALRSTLSGEQKLVDYIKGTGRQVIEAQLHQDLPFEKLVDELGVMQDQSRNPIFQVMFGVQGFQISEVENKLFEPYIGELSAIAAKANWKLKCNSPKF